MKLIAPILALFVPLGAGSEPFDESNLPWVGTEQNDGSLSLLQLRKAVQSASPEHGQHVFFNSSGTHDQFSGHAFGCTGRTTAVDVVRCINGGDVHEHRWYGGAPRSDWSGLGWYWMAKSIDGSFQAQAFVRQSDAGWSTMSHFVLKFGDTVVFLDRDAPPNWDFKYIWNGAERSYMTAPIEVAGVYWANRGAQDPSMAQEGAVSGNRVSRSSSGSDPKRHSCFEYQQVSVWTSFQTWQNVFGPYGAMGTLEIEGESSYLDVNYGQCARDHRRVTDDEMLVTPEQNAQICMDNGLTDDQCGDPNPQVALVPTAEHLCVFNQIPIEHAQQLCDGQQVHGQDIYNDCVYDVCASADADAQQAAAEGAAMEAAMMNPRAVCAVNADDCRPCNICFEATEVDLSNVVQNNLGGAGPDGGAEEIRFRNAITTGGRNIDVVLVAENAYVTPKPERNGYKQSDDGTGFGRFTIRTGTTTDFTLLFQDSQSRAAVSVQDIALTFYDLDEGREGDGVQRELISACGAEEIYLTEDTELIRTDVGACTRFTSSTIGTGQDNPRSPSELTMTQAARSVTYEFHSRASISFTSGVTGLRRNPRPVMFSFKPQVACGASDSETPCVEYFPPPPPPPPAEGALRLSGGEDHRGRLEIYHSFQNWRNQTVGMWGTICDDSFDANDAMVACQQLGFPRDAREAHSVYTAGGGADPIWLDDMGCTGEEDDLQECTNIGWGSHNCGHSEDVGVECVAEPAPTSPPFDPAANLPGSEGALRLRGDSNTRGRLEIFHDGQWGSICDDSFDLTDATVACRQLGFFNGATESYTHGGGDDPIWLDDLHCEVANGRLDACPNQGWGTHNCGHSEDVGVACAGDSEGALRLGDGNDHRGRLEIFHNGEWGTVCNDHFDASDAAVACLQLGFPRNNAHSVYAHGGGADPIFLDDVSCNGEEDRLTQCSNIGWGTHNCGHGQDVGVECLAGHAFSDAPGTEGSLRLNDGANNRGRLEIYHDGSWGTICDDSFDVTDAHTACRQLGFEFGALESYTHGGGADPILLDDLGCDGHDRIVDCPNPGWGIMNCGHGEDVGVECVPNLLPGEGGDDGDLRLSDGSEFRGRLEIFHGGRWGTICDDSFDMTDAISACHQLGFANGASESYTHGGGSDPIWLDDLACTDAHGRIDQCPNPGWGIQNCGHSEDVGIACISDDSGGLRLSDGSDHRGRLEVFFNGQWGTVCDDNFDEADARVACHQLGFPRNNAHSVYTHGGGADPILLDDISCDGQEDQLAQCGNPGWGTHNCGHSEDVGVECDPREPEVVEPDAEGGLRLVGGSSTRGRLEIFHDGTWGTICDDSFDVTDAHTACRQLGFFQGAVASYTHGGGADPIFLDDLACSGHDRIDQCPSPGWGNHNCGHGEDVGVECVGNPPPIVPGEEGNVRLWDGTDSRGRLEIFHDGQWGTICDDAFDMNDATTACRQLGFANGATESYTHGGGSDPIWLDDLACTDAHGRIDQCPNPGWGTHNCGHNEDVGVACTAR